MLSRVGSTLHISPASKPNGLVILAHGLGDSSQGFADVARYLSQTLGTVKFVVPTAPNSPVTINGGMSMPSWYDITSLGESRSDIDAPGVEQSMQSIVEIMDKENTEQGIPYKKMILGGFSQGGALSLFTGLQLPPEKRVGGILCMSGYLVARHKFKLEKRGDVASTPILHMHGTQDPMVQYKWALQTREWLEEAGATNYSLQALKGVEHTITVDELQSAANFIQQSLNLVDDTKKMQDMDINELYLAIEKAGLGDQAIGLLEKQDLFDLLDKHTRK